MRMTVAQLVGLKVGPQAAAAAGSFRASVMKSHKLGGLHSRTHPLTLLGARSPPSRCWQVWPLLRLGERLYPRLPLGFCLPAILSVPWLIDASLSFLMRPL